VSGLSKVKLNNSVLVIFISPGVTSRHSAFERCREFINLKVLSFTSFLEWS